MAAASSLSQHPYVDASIDNDTLDIDRKTSGHPTAELITVEKAALELGRARKTIDRLIKKGRIKATFSESGRVIGIERSIVEELRAKAPEALTKPSPGVELHRTRVLMAVRAIVECEDRGEKVDVFRLSAKLGILPREIEEAMRQRVGAERALRESEQQVARAREEAARAERRAIEAERQAKALADLDAQRAKDAQENAAARAALQARTQDPTVPGSEAAIAELVELECKGMALPGDAIAQITKDLGGDTAEAWRRVDAWCSAHRDKVQRWQANPS